MWKFWIYTFSYRLVHTLNGLLPCMKVLKLVSTSPFLGIICGNGPTYCLWSNWEAGYQQFNALKRQGRGILCANFVAPVLGLPLYHKSWCPGCYSQRRGTSFSVYTGSDPTNSPNACEWSRNFISARPVDSLFRPFNCDECAFFQLKGVSSRSDNKYHQIILYFIRHSNLDDFWSCYTGTVTKLTWIFHEKVALGNVYGFQMFPQPMDPFPPEYDGGIRAGIGVMHRSNRLGKHEAKLKFYSACKALSMRSNMFVASALGVATE